MHAPCEACSCNPALKVQATYVIQYINFRSIYYWGKNYDIVRLVPRERPNSPIGKFSLFCHVSDVLITCFFNKKKKLFKPRDS